jgi:outer membrane lipoprotein-sorting protein
MRKSILLALAIAAIARPDSLEDVLTHMDAAAKEFKSYSANVKRLDYINIVHDTDETDGAMRLRRDKGGVVAIIDFTSGPDRSVIHFIGTSIEKYLPKANEVQIYNLRKSAPAIEQFFLLGFSTTREEMLRDYDVKLGGPDKVGSIETTRIVLTPKLPETLKLVKTIELWFPNGAGNPIQQKGTMPNKDYKLATFSDLQLNPTLPLSAFELPPEAARAKRTKLN